MISKKLKTELLRFLLVGGIAVLIDATVYFALVKLAILHPSSSKRVSFACGAIWAFFMNKYYTFSQKQIKVSEPLSFSVVYLVGWLLNSVTHDILYKWTAIKLVAFLFATAVSTCSNFIGQKLIVFRTNR